MKSRGRILATCHFLDLCHLENVKDLQILRAWNCQSTLCLVTVKINVSNEAISKEPEVSGRNDLAEGKQESKGGLCRMGCWWSQPLTSASDDFVGEGSEGRRVPILTQVIKHLKCKKICIF